MVDFDQPMIEVLDKWLGANSTNNDTRLMLKACDIKTYVDFRSMGKSSVAALERISNQATIKLKEVHAIRVNDILSYIAFIETSNEKLAENSTQWDISHFRK